MKIFPQKTRCTGGLRYIGGLADYVQFSNIFDFQKVKLLNIDYIVQSMRMHLTTVGMGLTRRRSQLPGKLIGDISSLTIQKIHLIWE